MKKLVTCMLVAILTVIAVGCVTTTNGSLERGEHATRDFGGGAGGSL